MSRQDAQIIFKVVPRAKWEHACRVGAFAGSEADRSDGFIHLSSLHQLAGTLAKHFAGQRDLLLIALDSGALREALRWEPSRGGDLFPHLYADLPTNAALGVHALQLDADGVPIVPQAVRQC